MIRRSCAMVFIAVLFLVPWRAGAAEHGFGPPPLVPAADVGKLVESVSVETFGVVKPAFVYRFLALHRGERLSQDAVAHDYSNLAHLGPYNARLEVHPGSAQNLVRLRWIVMSKWLKPTEHPFYGDAPLSAPIQGVGWILTSPQVDRNGGNFSSYTQLSRRANLARLLFTQPLEVDPVKGNASSLVVDTFGGRGVFRASEPLAINVYSWNAGEEALYLHQSTNGTQFEGGIRVLHSSNELSSNLVAPSLYPTNVSWAKTTQLAVGVSHACVRGPSYWYPPFCDGQFRFSISDGIGALGATDEYQVYSADVAHYTAIGSSTLALHATMARSGGVIPDSFLTCAVVRAYPKPFCGTDAEGGTVEFRINDTKSPPLEFVVFTEDAAGRVRQAVSPNILPYFTWHPDSGVGVIFFRFMRIDLAFGQAGSRLTFELKGETY
ncbi:MAG TPA: hypothetical protein VMF11_10120 [Candidatus Baltobacteraceae bacterium]|nr:hypothetical protein [Candidatus Baltobacteraceae bacterium]